MMKQIPQSFHLRNPFICAQSALENTCGRSINIDFQGFEKNLYIGARNAKIILANDR